MTTVKKKIMALIAAIVAVFAVSVGTTSAYADDYGASVTIDGTVVSVDFEAGSFEPGESVYITVDTDEETYGPYTANSDGSLSVQLTLSANALSASTITVTGRGATSGAVVSVTVDVPQVGTASEDTSASSAVATSSDNLPQTGTTVLPYIVAVVLLAIAGVAVHVVRKQYNR